MKKMNKKGFTLIELLAIIVILAIIAVITVPIILNVIDNAKKGAAKNSVIGYGKAVELAYTQYQFDQQFEGTSEGTPTGISIVSGTSTTAATVNVSYDGSTVTCSGKPIFTDGKLEITGCKADGYDQEFTYSSGKAE